MSSVQLIKELREKITDAYRRIRLLETEIQDKVSEIYKLQKELDTKEIPNAKYNSRYGWTIK
jgi:hypothetical protein